MCICMQLALADGGGMTLTTPAQKIESLHNVVDTLLNSLLLHNALSN